MSKTLLLVGARSELAQNFIEKIKNKYSTIFFIYREKDRYFENNVNDKLKKCKCIFIYSNFEDSFHKKTFSKHKKYLVGNKIDILLFQSPKPQTVRFINLKISEIEKNLKVQSYYSLELIQYLIGELKPKILKVLFTLTIYNLEPTPYLMPYLLAKNFNEKICELLNIEYPNYKFLSVFPSILRTKFLSRLHELSLQIEEKKFKSKKYLNTKDKLTNEIYKKLL